MKSKLAYNCCKLGLDAHISQLPPPNEGTVQAEVGCRGGLIEAFRLENLDSQHLSGRSDINDR